MTEDNSNYSWEGDAQDAKAAAAQAAKDAQAVKHAAVLEAVREKAAQAAKDGVVFEAVHEKNPFYSEHLGSEITNSLEALIAIKYWVFQIAVMVGIFTAIGIFIVTSWFISWLIETSKPLH